MKKNIIGGPRVPETTDSGLFRVAGEEDVSDRATFLSRDPKKIRGSPIDHLEEKAYQAKRTANTEAFEKRKCQACSKNRKEATMAEAERAERKAALDKVVELKGRGALEYTVPYGPQ